MSGTPDPTLEPQKLVDDNGNYCLQHEDVYALLKYVWTGVLLPQTLDSFKARVHFKGSKFDPKLEPSVLKLIENYKVIQAHSKQFKDVTYPGIVSLASDVKNYAQDVGGNADTSYYAVLLQSCIDLDDEQKKSSPDQSKVADLKDTIKGIVDAQLDAIEKLRVRAKAATQSLRDYEEQTKQDQNALQTTKGDLDAILTGPGGDIATLEGKIAQQRQELIDDLKEYEHDVIVACTTLTYCWIPIVGMIAAATVAGIYGDKAVKMKKAMQALQTLVDSNDETLKVDKNLVAETHLVEADTKSVLDVIGPAITAIEKMIGVWDSIANDLQAIKDFVETRSTQGNKVIRKLNQRKIIEKWNSLKDAVVKYQQAAYISPQEETDLNKFIGDWGKAKGV